MNSLRNMLILFYKRITIIGLFWFSFITISSAQNLLKNPGFELDVDGWSNWGGYITNTKHSGRFSIEISNTKPTWTGIDQSVILPEGAKKIAGSGWIKTDNIVQGTQAWEVARIGIEFYNAANELVGGYPPVIGSAQGTTAWSYYEQEYEVPQGAVKVKVQLALGNCTGTANFDDISIIIFNAQNKPLAAGNLSGPMDKGKWYALKTDPTKSGSHYVDWSSLLDAPAGKHGFITYSNQQLQFQDGTPVRFWGTNLVAGTCFPATHAMADSLAQRLAKMGCNLVRMHHMDAPWSNPNVFGSTTSTRQLDPKSMDKVDYLIAALKKKGIYVFLDFLVHRDFTVKDGVPNRTPDLGGKQVAYFDTTIIDLQKEYIQQWMDHFNPYTKKAYKNEPAIIASEFVNESSIMTHFGGDLLNGYYRTELEQQYAAAGNPPNTLAKFGLNWDEFASPTIKNIRPNSNVPSSLRFLKDKEDAYYQSMYKYTKFIGVKYLLAGSNYPMPILSYQENNSRLDLVITNDYWDHPQVWKINNDWERIELAPINNTSIIRNYSKSFIHNMAKYQWVGKPFMITEYNACYPNEYILEGIPMIAAYSRLQGMDGLMQFAFDHHAVGSHIPKSFDLSTLPDHLANWVVGAPMYLKNYVTTAPNVAVDRIQPEEWRSIPNYSDYLDKAPYLPYVTRVAKSTTLQETPLGTYAKFYQASTGTITSETNELKLNPTKGTFDIQTPYVQGAVGEIADQAHTFPAISISTANEWCSVLLCSADGNTIETSKKLYLVITTPVKLTGQKYAEDRLRLEERGDLPYLVRQFEGVISLPLWKEVQLTPLQIDGSRAPMQVLNAVSDKGIQWDASTSEFMVYEIVVVK